MISFSPETPFKILLPSKPKAQAGQRARRWENRLYVIGWVPVLIDLVVQGRYGCSQTLFWFAIVLLALGEGRVLITTLEGSLKMNLGNG